MTLKFSRIRAVVMEHVPTKFHRAEVKKTPTKTLQSIATADSKLIHSDSL